MPKLKKTRQNIRTHLIKHAKKLAKKGLTLSEISAIIGKSEGWISMAVRDLYTAL